MTAGGPNEYGDDSKGNRFTDPATGEEYFLIIDKKTGKTKIYNEELLSDKYIGEYDPKTGKIKYNNNWWGGARKEEKAFFNDNKHLIKNQAKKIVIKEKKEEEGLNATEAANEASKLMNEKGVEDFKTTSVDGTSELGTKEVEELVYVYPASLRTTGNSQDTIQIRQVEYRASGLNQESLSGVNDRGKLSDKTKNLGSTVILPIPGGIGSNNETDWTSTNMTALDAAQAQFLMKTGESGLGDALNEVQRKFEKANLGDVKTALINAIASGAGSGNELLARTSGQIFNPNMELLFKAPQIRNFSFNFQFAPRNNGEAKTVLQIIRFFKQGMSPIRTEGNLFLKTPHIFELKYTHKGGDHKGLNKFKECALTGCQVDYTPDANYSTFEDGVMTSYGMTLGFKELTPIYNDDYGKQVPAEIGF